MMLTLMITLVSLLALCAAPLVLIMVCFKSNDKEDDQEKLKKAMAEGKVKKENKQPGKFDDLTKKNNVQNQVIDDSEYGRETSIQ